MFFLSPIEGLPLQQESGREDVFRGEVDVRERDIGQLEADVGQIFGMFTADVELGFSGLQTGFANLGPLLGGFLAGGGEVEFLHRRKRLLLHRKIGVQIASQQPVESLLLRRERVLKHQQLVALLAQFRFYVQAVRFENGLLGEVAVGERGELSEVFQGLLRAGNLRLRLHNLIVGFLHLVRGVLFFLAKAFRGQLLADVRFANRESDLAELRDRLRGRRVDERIEVLRRADGGILRGDGADGGIDSQSALGDGEVDRSQRFAAEDRR